MPVETALGRVGTLVCYDGFHDSLVEHYDGLGVESSSSPRTTSTPWDGPSTYDPAHKEGENWLRTGCPAIIQGRENIRYGVNAMLVGAVFEDMLAEGLSSVAINTGRAGACWEEGILAIASRPDAEEIVGSDRRDRTPEGATACARPRRLVHVQPLNYAPVKRAGGQISYLLLGGEQFGSKNLAVTWVECAPGSMQAVHGHPDNEQVYVIVRGRGVMHVGDEMQEVGEGTLVLIPPGAHAIKNPATSLWSSCRRRRRRSTRGWTRSFAYKQPIEAPHDPPFAARSSNSAAIC